MVQEQIHPSAKRAVVLLSGGLDSATALAIARDAGFRCIALTFRYGQRHEIEVQAAAEVARTLAAEQHITLPIDLRAFGGSALTDEIDVPKDRTEEDMAAGIPVTYVPARNLIFLSHAVACAEVNDAPDIFIGVNAIDYSGYPDCRADFIRSFEKTANLGTKAGVEGDAVRIHTPLIDMTKSQIIQRGVELGIDYSMTISCYDPANDSRACGRCDACLLRARGFAEAGVGDPARSVQTPASSASS